MSSNYIYEPYEQTFTNVNTVVVTHDFYRVVAFKLYISDRIAEAEYIPIDDNSFRLNFYEKGVLANQTGKVVVS